MKPPLDLEAEMHCEHTSCHCQGGVAIERQGRDYCSEGCADAAPGGDETCRCGHAGCAGEELLALLEHGEPSGPAAGSL